MAHRRKQRRKLERKLLYIEANQASECIDRRLFNIPMEVPPPPPIVAGGMQTGEQNNFHLPSR